MQFLLLAAFMPFEARKSVPAQEKKKTTVGLLAKHVIPTPVDITE